MKKPNIARAVVAFLLVLNACGNSDDSNGFDPNGKGGSANGGAGGFGGLVIDLDASLGGNAGSGGGGGTLPLGPDGVPIGFTKTDTGAWKLGPRLTGTADAAAPSSNCGSVITAVVRDFKDGKQPGGHPDFEHDYDGDVNKNLVKDTLGADQKPVYASAGATSETTSPEDFRQWYIGSAVNQTFSIQFFLVQQPGGKYTFDSNAFFPLDGSGFGNQGHDHNFHFTTEVHTEFLYKGGESFSFQGDDDLWVFINKTLAIDLGGIHGAASQEIKLDAVAGKVGITKNSVYSLDLFHAERHTSESHFRIDTTLVLVNCGTIIPDPIE